MQRIAAGDRAAFAVLVRRHQHAVTSLAYRLLGRWDAAEDVCQNVFVRVWLRAGSYQPQARFQTWLYRVVANLCWDERRRSARRAEPLTLATNASVSDPAELERAERAAQVRAAVSQLSDRQRLALVLHRYDGLSHEEIAQITGWSVSAVESCLVRAYERLRRTLAE
ncbi:MAG: sigma-70 family RNA polymerase sigma factor [Planctomycetota bacterium]